MPLKSITRFITLASLFLIPIFPLIVANSYFFPFITGKAFYFRILVEVGFTSWLILAFLDAKYRPRFNALTVGVTVFALVTIVADLLGVNPIRSFWSNFERMEGWITVIHLWMLFMVMSSIFGYGEDSRRLWRRWFNFELTVAILVAFYGIFQLLGWAAIHQGSSRIDASLGNSAYMAVYMLLNGGVAVYMLFESKVRRAAVAARRMTDSGLKNVSDMVKMFDMSAMEWVYAVLAVLFAFELYETATRGTILGLVGGIMVALLVYSIFAKNASRMSRRLSGGFVGFIVLLVIIFIAIRHQPFIEKNPILGRLASISFSSSETTARLYIWHMALTGFSERPVLGWGQENFNYIFNANYNPAMWGQEQWFDRAHSVYFDWLTASGVVGLAAYLSLYILALIAIWKSDLTVAEKSALTGLGAGYAIHNIFVFDNLSSYVLFFVLLAFISNLSRKDSAEIKGSATSLYGKVIFSGKQADVEVVEYIVVPVMVIALVVGLYFFNVRPIEANTRLITALQSCGNSSPGSFPDPSLFQDALNVGVYTANQEIREQLLSCADQVISSQQLPTETRQAYYLLATKEIQNQIAATPKDARIYTLAGSFYDQIGAITLAEPLLEKAHLLSPAKQSIDQELATDYINNGKADKALALLKQAYESATDDTAIKNAYALVMVIDGQETQARAMFNNDPSIFETSDMAQAYASLKQYSKAIAIYQALIGTSTNNVNLQASLAQVQYAAGMKSAAVATLQLIEKNHPEYKDQIDAAIKQVQG